MSKWVILADITLAITIAGCGITLFGASQRNPHNRMRAETIGCITALGGLVSLLLVSILMRLPA